MEKKNIIDAYCRIRTIDNTIPDDVLDFMKDCAIKHIESSLPNTEAKEETNEAPFGRANDEQDNLWLDVLNLSELWDMKITTAETLMALKSKFTIKRKQP